MLSMTLEERKKPEIMNGSRRARVAKGAGRPISEVNRLLEQFREMQKMMKKAAVAGWVVGSSGLGCLVAVIPWPRKRPWDLLSWSCSLVRISEVDPPTR